MDKKNNRKSMRVLKVTAKEYDGSKTFSIVEDNLDKSEYERKIIDCLKELKCELNFIRFDTCIHADGCDGYFGYFMKGDKGISRFSYNSHNGRFSVKKI